MCAGLAASTQAQNTYLNIVNAPTSGGRFVIPHNDVFNVLTTNSRTFTFRMMIPTGTPNNANFSKIFSKGDIKAAVSGLGLTFGSSSTLPHTDIRVFDNSSVTTPVNYGNINNTSVVFATINDGNWHHIAVVYNDTDIIGNPTSKVKVFYDGVFLAFASNTTNVKTGPIDINNTLPIAFGATTLGGGPMSAAFDDIRIWDHSLTPAEVATDAATKINAGTAPTTSGLLAAYDFESSTIDTAGGVPDITGKTSAGQALKNSSSTVFVIGSSNLKPDLPLLASSTTIENEIIGAVKKFSDRYLGTTAPTSAQLSTAITQYNTFIANVAGTDLATMDFLRVFARELKYNAGNTTIKGYADNAVSLAAQAVCDGTIDEDYNGYNYRIFGRAAILLGVMDGTNIVPAGSNTILSATTKNKLTCSLYATTSNYQHYWLSDSDYASYQLTNDAINTDFIYNKSDIMMTYCLYQNTMDERFRYMRGFQRYMNRFFSYSSGTANGIKPDGSGFHHWTAYNSYMYAYETAINNLLSLDGTRFQVGVANYKAFRNAVLAQRYQATDNSLQALSTCGRKPAERIATISSASISNLAIVGGKILGLSTADPVLAGYVNRVSGVNPAFNYNTIAPFEEGFIQLNYSNSGIYRKRGATKNWVAVSKGFTKALWGTESDVNENRYGRYQSYGALEILYPGNQNANGYSSTTWDWSHSPGTTVIKLPWGQLHAERERLDELQFYAFAGSLAFKQKNLDYLADTYGDFGLSGMLFQQLPGKGWGAVYGPETHNSSFEFRKSNFFFDDIIVSLASGIINNDIVNPTVTTLYQRMNNSGVLTVNGTTYSADGNQTFSGSANNWILDNYGTGFYVLADGTNSIKITKGNQQVPQHSVIWSGTLPSTNPIGNYYTGYIDHGTNPSNKGYEYIIKPNASLTDMQNMNTTITAGNKPYTVHQKNNIAHILEYNSKKIFGYCAFASISGITVGNIKSINTACLVMADNSVNGKMLLSLSNPDLGIGSRSYAPSVSKIIDVVLAGQWTIDSPTPGVVLVSSDATQTLLRFTTIDGNAYELNLTNANLGLKSDTILEQSLQIYPNPNKGQFTLNYNGTEALQKLALYSVTGQLVKVVPLENFTNHKEINIPELKVGLYLLKIKTENAVATKKIIIE